MSEMEDQLGAILGDPEMMGKIMSLAQSMASPASEDVPVQGQMPEEKGLDLGMVQKLAGFAKNTGIDQQQRALLSALRPYLHRERIEKLEKAMRAAKIAQQASGLLESGGFKLP